MQARLEQLQAGPGGAVVPPQYLCQCLGEEMADPVFAMDGMTYERAAIETWLQRWDRSPMTNLSVPATLVPNIGIRQLIAELDDGEEGGN